MLFTKDDVIFQKNCMSAIKDVTPEEIDAFERTTDSFARIKLLYKTGKKVDIPMPDNGKNLEEAERKKTEGNSYFAKLKYENALIAYNEGILVCPQDNDKSRELLTILVSNRSATYFELKEYKRVFDDIDYVTVIGNYPPHLQYKIWLRKAKCYDALQNERLSSEAYEEAVKCLKLSKLDDAAFEKKMKEIEAARIKKIPPVHHAITPIRNPDPFIPNKTFIALSERATIKQDSKQGRYAVAKKDIEAGSIILEELPHGFVIQANNRLTNCNNCLASISQPIPCSCCGHIAFCSTFCENVANSGFHKYECGILKSMFDDQVSVNLLLALRLVTQKSLQFFKEKYSLLKEYMDDGCIKEPIKKNFYRFDDYELVFSLCRNEKSRQRTELMHLTVMAIYLIRLLIKTRYFGKNMEENDKLTNDQLYIAALMLRHLEIVQYNSHEISEIRNSRDPKDGVFNNHSLGAAVYPTLALFNHSCDPSVIRYNVKTKIVVRAIKPIKAGDMIYENYGPLFMSKAVSERQNFLLKMYAFQCSCRPCTELWPKYDDLEYEVLRVKCQTIGCRHIFTVRMNDDPMSNCPLCNKMTPVIKSLGALMSLDDILSAANDFYAEGFFYQATEVFLQALTILYDNTEPPHPEMIKIQQRLKVCMLHMGNTAFGYVPSLSTNFM